MKVFELISWLEKQDSEADIEIEGHYSWSDEFKIRARREEVLNSQDLKPRNEAPDGY